MWALHVKKRLLEGRMSELFGSETLKADYFTRNFMFKKVGEMNEKVINPETKRLAQAYCDGMNQYARTTKLLPF